MNFWSIAHREVLHRDTAFSPVESGGGQSECLVCVITILSFFQNF